MTRRQVYSLSNATVGYTLQNIYSLQVYVVHDVIYFTFRVSEEERSIFWEVIVSVILTKTVYVHVSYSELFPRYNYFTIQLENC
jgi:hypothetical protein